MPSKIYKRTVTFAGIVVVAYLAGYAWLRTTRALPRTSGGENVLVLKVWDLPITGAWELAYDPLAALETRLRGMPVRVYSMDPDKRGAQSLSDGWGWNSRNPYLSPSPAVP